MSSDRCREIRRVGQSEQGHLELPQGREADWGGAAVVAEAAGRGCCLGLSSMPSPKFS